MLLALVAIVLGAVPSGSADRISGSAAVFWSGGRTWVVDADAGALYFAAGWYASEGRRVHRYRLRTSAERPAVGERARRWTALEHTVVGERRWREVTPPASEALHDERSVLQFLGDRAVVARFVRTDAGRTASATTWRLPEGGPVAAPAGTATALAWLDRRLEVRAKDARGIVERELPGGSRARWLVTADDRGGTVALALDRGAPFRPGVDVPDVVDLRASPDGTVALVLTGAALRGGSWRLTDLLAAHDPCDTRRLLLWRADGAHVELGEVARLDGARWLPPEDPLRSLVATRFLPALAPSCFTPLAVAAPGVLTAHRCRADEVDRAWGGPLDLAAAAGMALDDTAQVTVHVRDPERVAGDGVRLYFGRGRPASVTVTPTGLEPHGRQAQRTVLREAVRARWRPVEDGYTVVVDLPLDLVGEPPAVTVQVTDADADGTVRLWAAGERVALHQPRATDVTR